MRAILPSKLGKVATQQLRELILTGEFPAGARLLEGDLAKAMEISRTPVREALSQLCFEGLVQAREGRGLAVSPLSTDEVENVYPLLAALERFALEHTEAVTESLCDQIDALNEQLESARTRSERIEIDGSWHDHLIAESANHLVVEYLRPLRLRARRYEHIYMISRDHVSNSCEEHRRIAEELRAGAIDRAALHVEQHWLTSMQPLLEEVSEA